MIQINIKKSLGGLRKIRDLTHAELDQVGEVYLRDIKRTAPVETGKLKDDIVMRRDGRDRVIAIKTKRSRTVAGYLIDGTEDHFVAPKKAEALHFVIGGKDYFSKGHMVSGIPEGYWDFEPSANAKRQAKKLVTRFLNAK